MKTREFIQSLRGEKYYITTRRGPLILALVPFWILWFAMSFFPALGLLMYTLPTVTLTSIPIILYCEVWLSFGYKKLMYYILNILALAVALTCARLLYSAGALEFIISLFNPTLLINR